ncbi:hypothetical protein BN1708_017951, partial [Verticillium longisporum]
RPQRTTVVEPPLGSRVDRVIWVPARLHGRMAHAQLMEVMAAVPPMAAGIEHRRGNLVPVRLPLVAMRSASDQGRQLTALIPGAPDPRRPLMEEPRHQRPLPVEVIHGAATQLPPPTMLPRPVQASAHPHPERSMPLHQAPTRPPHLEPSTRQ